jgi:ABC-type sugar transport system substrate-binding protein
MGTYSYIALAATLLMACIYFISGYFRGRLRTRLATLGIVGGLAAISFLTAFLSSDLGWSKSDLLTLAGILISVLLALAASEYARKVRRLRVGIVIPSRRAFHRELRRGLREMLDSRRYVTFDPYAESDGPEEDLSSFIPNLHQVIQKRSDVLVICAPSVDLANSAALIGECKRLARRGAHIFFIESVPSEAVLAQMLFVTTLASDSKEGAKLIAEFVRHEIDALPESDRRKAQVLVIPGPQHSRPANERLTALKTALSGLHVEVSHSQSWTADEARDLAAAALERSETIKFICCGNDDMAQGASWACFDRNRHAIEITGHDGLYNTVVSIADPFSPISATIRIPPKSYGFRIGAAIEALPPRWGLLFPGGQWLYRAQKREVIVLPITQSNVVTCYTAPLLLHADS